MNMRDGELKNWLRNELFERIPANIAIIDRDFRIVEANESFIREFGEGPDHLCFKVFKNREAPCQGCKAQLTFDDGKGRVTEEWRLNKDGRDSYYVVHLEPIKDEEGKVAYVIEMSSDVTESRRLQREYDLLFDRVPCYVVVLDREMTIVRNNELFRKTFGDSLGKRCFHIYKQQDHVCGDCPARRTFEDGGLHTTYQVGTDKHGRTVHYIVTTAPLSRGGDKPTHVIEMALDVTQTKILEERLKEAFDFQESLINSAMDGIIGADEEGKIMIFNPSAERLFKYGSREVIGLRALENFAPHEFVKALAEGNDEGFQIETRITDKEGTEIPARFTGTSLTSEGKYLGAAGFFQDLSEIKQLEREMLEAERLAAVGQTVAGLAHGIKNVLTGLEGGMYVVNSGMKKDDRELTRKGWEMLQNNIERITTYVKDFLNFARGRAPSVTVEDPSLIAREVYDLYKDVAAQSGVRLTADFQEGVAPANLDHEGIHTCLVNLVSNAIDACEMSDKKDCGVHMRTYEEGDWLYFEVRDDGCGMDYEVKKKVFTTFFSTKGSGKGTGLGLLVTRRITQEHGGRVNLSSAEGEGSTFRLEFKRSRLPELTGSGENKKA